MLNPFNTATKKVVRDAWNTPVLSYLYDHYGFKFRYFGLPGVDLLDIITWNHLIEEIVAFEIPSKGKNPRSNLVKLKANLEELGKPYQVHYGSMEQVILTRADFDGTEYKQTKFINLYNLDFCDQITSKINTPSGRMCLRYELIRQLLNDQHQVYSDDRSSNMFILMITARNQTQSDKILSLLQQEGLATSTFEYFQGANAIRPIPETTENLIGSHGWALKAFMYDTVVNRYFSTPHISALNFPMLKYDGTPTKDGIASPMVHWMILCKFENIELPMHKILPSQYLQRKSVRATETTITVCEEPAETLESHISPIGLLREHESQFFS